MGAKPGRWCASCREIHAAKEVCPRRVAFGRKRKGGVSGRGGRVWRETRERIFRRDGFLCQICRVKGLVTAVELHGVNHGVCDHIIPLSEGGEGCDANLQTICQGCDKEKTLRESMAGRGRLKV